MSEPTNLTVTTRRVTPAEADKAIADIADFIHLETHHAKSGRCDGDNDGCPGGPDGTDLERAEQAWAAVKEDCRLREDHDLPDPGAVELPPQQRPHPVEGNAPARAPPQRPQAPQLDGGTGPDAHHGCPDPSITSADCTECHMTIDAEVAGGGRRSIFATED